MSQKVPPKSGTCHLYNYRSNLILEALNRLADAGTYETRRILIFHHGFRLTNKL